MSYVVTVRGKPACPCLAEWIPAYEAELQRREILKGELRIYQLIGGYVGSGGTHTDGGAGDFIDMPGTAEEVWVARQMGADASWTRPYNWDGDGGIAHQHTVLTGCPHNGPARYQIDEVRAGGDGLVGSARDTGPRPLSGRTWREGIAWAREQGDEMKPEDFTRIRDIIREENERDAAEFRKELGLANDGRIDLGDGKARTLGQVIKELWTRRKP